jgi:hypothetical protein
MNVGSPRGFWPWVQVRDENPRRRFSESLYRFGLGIRGRRCSQSLLNNPSVWMMIFSFSTWTSPLRPKQAKAGFLARKIGLRKPPGSPENTRPHNDRVRILILRGKPILTDGGFFFFHAVPPLTETVSVCAQYSKQKWGSDDVFSYRSHR